MRIYFDSCILIYRIERRAPWAQRVDERLAAHEAEAHVAVITELTRLECRVRPLARGLTDMLRDYGAFFARPNLLWQQCDRSVFDLAAELRARHGLKTPDALHLAAALIARCDEFWTNDKRLEAAAATSIRIVVPAGSPPLTERA